MIKDSKAFRLELEKSNEWWYTNRVAEAEKYPFKRKYFNKIINELETRRITILVGLRRVGKSILLKQVIASLLKKVSSKNIFYISLDDPALYAYSDLLMKDAIDYWLENIAGKDKKYIFLDEIHLYKEWYKWLKSYYDKYHDIKFIISGSSSLALQKDANKYLRGRTVEIEIYPLDFNEFLELSGIKIEKIDIENVDEFKLKEIWLKIKDAFKDYLLVGGFPEWFELKQIGIKDWFSRLVNDIPKKAIYEDISILFGIKNLKALETMLAFIAAHQSKVLAYETINDMVKLDHETLVSYVEFLKSSYIIIEILKFASIKEQLKAKKKYLIIDQGLRNAILKEYEVKEDNVGFIIENLVGVKLYSSCKEKNENLFYFTNEEIDFVIKGKKSSVIEVKYRERIEEKYKRNMLKLMEKFDYREGIIVTKNLFKKEKIKDKTILFIPAWLFLLVF